MRKDLDAQFAPDSQPGANSSWSYTSASRDRLGESRAYVLRY